MDRWIGSTLKGTYRVDSILGEGGMGVVYRGIHLALGKPIAIKTLIPGAGHSIKARERFQREALLGSKLTHPSVAHVFDYGEEQDVPFIVMEFVEGLELTDVIREEAPIAPQRALTIMQQLAGVLREAERHNLLHRDIKPQNIRILNYKPGESLFIKVLDFGIAKSVGTEQEGLTTAGNIIGTPRYLAPEQVNTDGRNIDCRADQYSAGILFYELLTGSVPFRGETVASLLLAHVNRPPSPLPLNIPESIRRVVMRMLSKDPALRYPTAIALERALAACLRSLNGTPIEQLEQDLGPSAESWIKRRLTLKNMQIALSIGLFILIAGIITYAIQRRAVMKIKNNGAIIALQAQQNESDKTKISAAQSKSTSESQSPKIAPQGQGSSIRHNSNPSTENSTPDKTVNKPRQSPTKKVDPFDVEIAR